MSEFKYILEKVFADNKISRSEKEAINKVIEAKNFDENELAFLRSQLFDFAKASMKSNKGEQFIQCLEDLNKLLIPKAPVKTSNRAYFSPGEECRSCIISQIRQAKKSIDICVFTISDNLIVREILEAQRQGIKVRIVSDNDKQHDRGSDVIRMQEAGIPIRTDITDDHMHHKFAIFDQKNLILGSYNWTRSAALNNNEDIIITNDPGLIDDFSREFETLWENYK